MNDWFGDNPSSTMDADLGNPEDWPRRKPGPRPEEETEAKPAKKKRWTQDSIALRFVEQHRDKLRFCHHTAKWYVWTGAIWKPDDTMLAFDYARSVCRDLGGSKLARAMDAGAVERFARADRAFAVTSELWDRYKYLLGTPAGTIDLRTGELRLARQEDYITRATTIAPAENPDCPLWQQFVDQVTCHIADLRSFLQRWFGYCLTGEISEHSLLFCYGTGGNGKSVLLNTVSAILGDYAVMAALDTFTSTRGDKHPTDLARLRGARLVLASETEEGRSWDEQRVKAITGGDPIAARFMRQDFFTFRPEFKPVIYGNHKPSLRNVDEAMRRRLKMAPFNHRPAKPNLLLEQQLNAEAPGILRWLINGCLSWQQQGLAPPAIVQEATAEYFSDQDVLARWIDECCETGAGIGDTTASLYSSWKAYAIANGEEPRTCHKWFSPQMERLGYRPVRDCELFRGRGFRGIRVRQQQPAPHWQD
jgi:putative DNA primase/helicase